ASSSAAGHSRPGPAADELADLAADGTPVCVDDIDVLAERGKAQCDRLHRLHDAGREEARADLRAAGDVDDRRAPAADVLEEPQVRIAVPRLARGAHRL